jgi:hypothetical protein
MYYIVHLYIIYSLHITFYTWGLFYKTFYGRNLWIFVISQNVCP